MRTALYYLNHPLRADYSIKYLQSALEMLEEIQKAIYEVQGPSNPNIQLLVETLLIRWRAMLGS